MGRGTLTGTVVVLAMLIAAAPAIAAPVLVKRTAGVIEGPHLAGESIFFREIGARRMVMRLASPTSDRKLSSAQISTESGDTLDEESPGDYSSFASRLAASPERLAYKEAFASGNARYQVGQSSLTLYGGSLTGPFGQEDRCSSSDYFSPASAALDADGPRVAATDCTGQIVIRDQGTGPPTVTRISPGPMLGAIDVALAGRYVAFNAVPAGPTGTSPTVTVVHDWIANEKVYEVPRAASFDLQDDGTLAVSTGRADDLDCGDGKLLWYSRAEPTEHLLPVKPCTSEVRIAGGRVAVAAAAPGDQQRELALLTLDGRRTDIAQFGTDSMRRGSIDFDGARVAYALGNCLGGADLLTESATNPQQRAERAACPVRGLSSRDTLGPEDTSALVSIRCDLGCAGRLRITARVDGRARSIATRAVRISPDDDCGQRFHHVTISRAARAAMRRRGFLDTRLTVTTEDRDGAPRVTGRSFRLRAAPANSRLPRDCAA